MTISTDSKSAGRIVFALQIVQFQIAAAIVAIAAYRLLGTDIRTQRIETMVLGVSAKSLIIIAYEVLTSHVDIFRRFASLKANAILTTLELVFWPVAVGIVAYARIRWGCPAGLGCTLASIILALSAVMTWV